MNLLNLKEIKIFLTFFFIYSFFIYWVGWNEQSRFSLTRSIVDERRLEIDTHANQTTDRAYFNRHYYTVKAPGTSLLAAPIYASWEFIYYNFFPQDFIEKYKGTDEFTTTWVGSGRVPIFNYISPNFFVVTSMTLVTIFTSCLFGALTIVVVYKISRYFTQNESHRLLLVFTSGLGTLIFPYSLVFLEHIVVTFFIFYSFYLIFKVRQEKKDDKKYIILSGISSGFAVCCSLITGIILVIYLLYLLFYKKQLIFYFIFGSFVGILPLIFYNYIIFGTPFIFRIRKYYSDPTFWIKSEWKLEFQYHFIMLRLILSPFKGLFFYYPILLLSFAGFILMYRKFKAESILIFILFIVIFLVNTFWPGWWGGACFGSRYLTPIMPFLVLPLIHVFKDFESKKFLKYFTLGLIVYSIFVNFSGLQAIKDEVIGKDQITMASEYKEKVNSLSIIKNPIYDYYLPQFLIYGPRSRIFENIINKKIPIDIRYNSFEDREVFKYFYDYIPFGSLLPVIIVTALIWKKEVLTDSTFLFFKFKNYLISSRIFSFFSKHKKHIIIISIIIFFLCLPPLSIHLEKIRQMDKIDYGKNWYPQSPIEAGRWMRQDGIIIINHGEYSANPMEFSTSLHSYYQDREIQLYLNDELIDTFNVFSDKVLEYAWPLYLKPGKNIVKFHAVQECKIPNVVEKKEDKRCLSINSHNLNLSEPADFMFSKNWHPQSSVETVRWMSNNGILLILASENTSTELRMFVGSFYRNRTVKVYVNNKLLKTFRVSTKVKEKILRFKSSQKITPIEFYSVQDCEIPKEVIGGNDIRCVSISLSKIRLFIGET